MQANVMQESLSELFVAKYLAIIANFASTLKVQASSCQVL
jgi:hypothetical protein